MLLDLTYSEALALFGDKAQQAVEAGGFGDYVMESILIEQGFAMAKRHRVRQPGNQQRDEWPCNPWIKGFRYCALVKHQDGPAHSVAMLDDGRVLDPNSASRTQLTDFHEVCSITAIVPMFSQAT